MNAHDTPYGWHPMALLALGSAAARRAAPPRRLQPDPQAPSERAPRSAGVPSQPRSKRAGCVTAAG
jgi:hypothetical protein